MKIEITRDEQTILLSAIDKELASAKRSQVSAKQPQIQEVYKRYETEVRNILTKISAANETAK